MRASDEDHQEVFNKTRSYQHAPHGGLRAKGIFKKKHGNRILVTIITVVLNGEKHIAETIRSIRSQTYDNVEYIVIDGFSRDATIDILRKFQDEIDFWISEPDAGLYDAMNKGIALASGEIIGIVNADDYLEPDAVEAIVRTYEISPHPDVICGCVRFFNHAEGYSYLLRPSDDIYRDRFKKMPIPHPAAFVTRNAYQRYGLYSTQYQYGSDYDYVLRLLDKNCQFRILDGTITSMRTGGLSTHHYVQVFLEHMKIRRLHGCAPLEAWVRFFSSITKTFVVNYLTKLAITRTIYLRYKGSGS